MRSNKNDSVAKVYVKRRPAMRLDGLKHLGNKTCKRKVTKIIQCKRKFLVSTFFGGHIS